MKLYFIKFLIRTFPFIYVIKKQYVAKNKGNRFKDLNYRYLLFKEAYFSRSAF